MLQQQRGFSLFEMVIVVVVMGIISVVVGKVLFQAAQVYTSQKNASETDWQGLIALERLTNDIHQIRSKSDITTITSTQLSFTDVNNSSVSYTLSGSNLLRNSQILASGISSVSFAYRDSAGATTATAGNVRYISISLSLTQGNLNTSISTLVGTRGFT